MVEDEKGRAGALRASDTEREGAARSLATHFADGRLERAEFDERVDAAFAARTRNELRALFADLPGSPPLPELRRSEPGARASVPGRTRRRGPFQAGRAPLFPLVPILLALSVVAIVHGLPPFPLIALFAVLAVGRRRRRWNRGDLRPWH